MHDKLSLFDRMRMYWYAWRDTHHRAFQDLEILDDNKKIVDHFMVSSYMELELGQMEAKRAKFQYSRSAIFWCPIMRNRLKAYKVRRVSRAIDAINASASELQAEIQAVFVDYRVKNKKLREQEQIYENDQAPQYVRLCMNQAHEARQQFVKTEIRLYKMVISLLNQKISILKHMRKRMHMKKAKSFLRIRQYYYYASGMDDRLPVQYLGDELLAAVANISTVFPYENELINTQKQVDIYTQELSMLN